MLRFALFTCRRKQEQLFEELKRDLFKADNEMDDWFYHLSELKTATEKNFLLKRLFWKVGRPMRVLLFDLYKSCFG